MLFQTILLLQATVSAIPQIGGHDDPNSPGVLEALSKPRVYESLSPHGNKLSTGLQTPIENLFRTKNLKCGAEAGCPAWEGEVRLLNGRDYRIYCHNAPWGSYRWLPKVKSLEECEQQCHDHQLECNGLTYYPQTSACSIVYSEDAAPYIFDNGVAKYGAIPIRSDMAFSAGMLCPLPGSDNQVYDFGDEKQYQFKLSCRNQFRGSRRALGAVKNVDECGERCGADNNCRGFLYYQPSFPGGRVDGARNCDLVTTEIDHGDWVPLFKPNQYLAGLKVKSSDCGDRGFCRDECGKEGNKNQM